MAVQIGTFALVTGKAVGGIEFRNHAKLHS
jgi:hypothetical protein